MLHLPKKGTPALNWKANYGALRSEMNLGKPIFDSYRLPNGNLILEVQAGKIAPAFGQPGLGTQYLSPISVDVLLKRGIIGY